MKARAQRLPTEIDLDDEIEFQHRSWRFQRVGRVLVVAFVIAAAAGFFGGGFVGDTTERDPSGALSVKHPRFARHDSAYDVRIDVEASLVRDGKLAVSIDRSLLEGLVVEGIVPEPESVEQSGGEVVFHFKADSGGAPVVIDGYLRTRKAGSGKGKVGVVGGPSVALKHFIFP